jgi:hypothetical protein
MTYIIPNAGSICSSSVDCWAQFQSPEDIIELKINGKTYLNLLDSKTYVSNEFFILPFPNLEKRTSIEFTARDINQNIKFLNPFCVSFGNYNEVRTKNFISWFFNTGAQLFSAYFLFLVSLFLSLSFFIKKTNLGFSLLS